MKCQVCGQPVDDKCRFCPFCGNRIEANSEDVSVQQNQTKSAARGSHIKKIALLSVLVMASLFIVATLAFLGTKLYSDYQKTHLPNFVGLTETEAQSLADKYSLSVRFGKDVSDFEKGIVCEQSLEKGTDIQAVETLKLTISLGPAVPLPNVVDMEKEQAISELTSYASLISSIEYVYDNTVEKGKVIRTEPAASELIAPEGTVKLFVSKGKEIIVPDLQGKTFEEAETMLLELGVSVSREEQYHDTIERGCVISANKKSLAEGETITLSVSLGKDNRIPIPLVCGMTEQEALNEMHTAGFNNVTIVYQDTAILISANDANTLGGGSIVEKQSIKNKADPSETITLYVMKACLDIPSLGFSINSAGGVEVNMQLKNTGQKVIHYVDIEMAYFNRVGDAAICDIRRTNRMNLNFIGPLQVGEQEEAYWDATIYNYSTACLSPKKIVVTFEDGTKQTITNDFNYYWYSNDYIGGAPKD